MKAQELYDLREKLQFCSGNDLYEFFAAHLGVPCPGGQQLALPTRAAQFVENCLHDMKANNGGSLQGLYSKEEIRELADFCRVNSRPIRIKTPW